MKPIKLMITIIVALLFGTTSNGQVSFRIFLNNTQINPAQIIDVCAGQTVTFIDSSVATPAINVWQWRFKHSVVPTNIFNTRSATVTFNTPATDTVFLRVQSTTPPTLADSIFFIVRVNAIPLAPTITASGSTNICAGGTVTLSTTQTGVTYQWRLNGNPIAGATGASFNASNAGTYTLVVLSGGCLSSPSNPIPISTSPAPDPQISAQTANGTNFTNQPPAVFRKCGTTPTVHNLILLNQSSTIATNTNYVIDWGDNSPNYNAPTLPNLTNHIYPALGSYNLVLTVTGQNGCTASKTYTVYIGTNPAISLGNPGNTTGECLPRTYTFPLSGFASNSPGTFYTVVYNDGTPDSVMSHPPPSSITKLFNINSCGFNTPTTNNSFFVRVVASNPCGVSTATIDPIQISEGPKADFTISPNDTVCVNSSVNFINTSKVGKAIDPSPPHTCDTSYVNNWEIQPSSGWTITNGNTNSKDITVSFTNAGTYIIKLFVQNASSICGVDSIIKTICVNPNPQATFTLNQDSGCGPLAITATNTSNTLNSCGPNRYRWRVAFNGSVCTPAVGNWSFAEGTDSASINPKFVFTNTGAYGLTLTIFTPCDTVTSAVRNIYVISKPQAVLVQVPDFCRAATISPTTNPNPPNNCYSGNPMFYAWSFPGATPDTSNSASPTANYLAPGQYTYTASISNNCGATILKDSFIVHPLPPKVNVTGGGAYCAGGSGVPVGIDSSVTGIQYRLIHNGVVVAGPLTGNGNALSFGNQTLAGNYSVVATNTAVIPNCVDTMNGTAVVVVNLIPSIPNLNDTAICAGNIAMLQASATGTISWFTTATGGTPIATGGTFITPALFTTTNYFVMRTVAGCNSARDTVTVVVFPIPELNTVRTKQICSGESTAISVGSNVTGTTYSYTAAALGGVVSVSGFSSNLTPTSGPINQVLINNDTVVRVVRYILTPTANNCVGPADTVDVEVRPKPILTATATDSICSGGSVSFTLTPNISTATVGWNTTLMSGFASGFANVNNSFNRNLVQTITNDSNTNAVIRYTLAANNNGCVSDSQSLFVTVKPRPIVTTPSDSICSGSLSNLVLSSNVLNTQFIWSTNVVAGVTGNRDSLIYNAGPIQHRLTNSTLVPLTVGYTITPRASGCVGSSTLVNMRVKPLSLAFANNDTTCSGIIKPIGLSSNVTGSNFIWTAQLFSGNASGFSNQTAPTAGPLAQSVMNSSTGPATVRYSVRAVLNGCVGPDTNVFLNINPVPLVNATSGTICSGDTNLIPINSTLSNTFFSLTVSGGVFGATPQTVPIAGPIAQRLINNGTDTVRATYFITPHYNGCAGLPVVASTLVNPRPVMNAVGGEVCDGSTTAIRLSSNMSGTQYRWTVTAPSGVTGASNRGLGNDSIIQTLANTTTNNLVATYNVTPERNGCAGNTIPIAVTVKPRPQVSVLPTTQSICSRGIATINLSSNLSGASYTWTSASNPLDSVIGQTNRSLVSGPIMDTLTNVSATQASVNYQIFASVNGCLSALPANASVAVNPLPVVNAGADLELCNQNNNIQLTSFSPLGGGWSGAGIVAPSGLFNASVVGVGAHRVVYTFTNNITGCTNRDTLLITVTPPVQVNAGIDQFKCLNDASFQLTGTPAGGVWSGSSRVTATGVFSPTAVGSDTLVYSRGSGSCQTYDTMVVVVRPLPLAIVGSPATICVGQSISLGGSSTAGSFYSWKSNPIGDSSNLANPTFNPTTSKTYILREENSFGCSKTDSVFITVLPPISNNTIFGNQFLCGSGTPAALTGQAPSGGSGGYQFQWQDSTSGGVFNNIPGATTASFAPPNIAQTTAYRRIVTSGLCAGNNASISNVVRVRVLVPISGNAIGSNQEICAGATAQIITPQQTLSGGLGHYNYQWQKSSDSLNWTNTSNADTLVSYSPGSPTTTTFYRRVVTSATCVSISNVIKITVYSPIADNTIGTNQTVCGGQLSPQLTGSIPTGGKNNQYTYQWQESTNGITWFNIAGAQAKDYSPGVISTTTHFRRLVTSPPCDGIFVSNSNVVVITILPAIISNVIGSNQTICQGQIPANLFSATPPSGGSGTFTYQWQVSNNGSNWNNSSVVNSIFSFNSTLTQTTFFRRIAQSSACADTSNAISVNVLPQIINNVINPVNAICSGSLTDTIRGSQASAGLATVVYQWQDSNAVRGWQNISGATSLNLQPQLLTQTTFYRRIVKTVTNPTCEQVSSTVVAVVNPNPVASFQTSATCQLQPSTFTSNTSIASGAINNVKWYFGDGTPALISTASEVVHVYSNAGTYQTALVATSLAGCTDSVLQPIVIHAKPTASYLVNNVCLGNQTNFASNSTVLPGSIIDSLKWVFGDGTESDGINNTTIKQYANWGTFVTRLVVTTNNGCKDSTTRTARVNPLPVAQFSSDTVCFGQSTSLFNNSVIPFGTIQTYNWFFSDNSTTSNAQNPARVFTQSGSINVRLEAISDSGCTNVIVKPVRVHSPINPSSNTLSTNPSILCSGSVPSVINGSNPIGGATGQYNYTWQSSNDGITWSVISGANGQNLLVNTPLSQTTFYRRIVQSGSCAHTSDSIRILIVPPIINNVIAGSTAICAGTKADTLRGLVPTGAAIPTLLTYRWQDSVSGSSWQNLPDSIALGRDFVPPVLNNTTYYRRLVTSGLCTSVSNRVDIIVYPKPVASYSVDNICAGASANFVSNSNISTGSITSYEWFFGSGLSSGVTASSSINRLYVNAGSYQTSLIVTSNQGCKDTASKQIQVHPRPVASYTVGNVCRGTSSTFTSTSSVAAGSNINEYKWFFGVVANGTIGSPIINNLYAAPGTYLTQLVVTTNFGCRDTANRNTIVHPTPVVQFTFDTACLGQSTQFVNQSTLSSGSINSYLWSFGDAGTSNQVSPIRQYASHGLFNVKLKAVTDSACADSLSRSVLVHDIIRANDIASSQTICQGTIPNNLIGSQPIGGNGTYTYQWQSSTDKTNWINISNSKDYLFSAPLSFSTYYRRVVTSGRCQDISALDSIMVIPAISNNVIAGNATICTNERPDSIKGTVPVGGLIPTALTYRWQMSTDSLFWIDVPQSNTPHLDPGHLVNTVFYRRIVTSSVCNSISNVVKIQVNPKPLASFTANSACLNYPATFLSNSTVSSGGISLYDWNFGDGTSTGFVPTSSASRMYTSARTDTVRLIIQTNLGCRDTAYRLVTTHPKPVASYSVNNVCFGGVNHFVSSSAISSGTINNHLWKFGDGSILSTTSNNTNKIFTSSGSFQTRLIVTSNHGCVDSIDRTLSVNPNPTAQFTFDTVCFNQATQLINQSSISGGGVLSYRWLFADNNTTSNQTNITRVFTQTGQTNVKLVAVSDSLCADSIVRPVLVRQVITGNTISASTYNVCSGTLVPLINGSTPVGGNNIYIYTWQRSDNGISWSNIIGANSKDLTLTQALTNTTYFRRIVTSGTCSDISDSIQIFVLPPITANAISGSSVICAENRPDTIVGTTTAGALIPGSLNYQWQDSVSGGVWTNIAGANSRDYHPPFLINTTHYRRIVTSGVCTSTSNIISILVHPKPQASFTNNNACLGYPINFVSNSTVATGTINTFNWSYGNGFGATAGSTVTHNFDSSGSYFARLIVTTNQGCKDTAFGSVTVFAKPRASYTATNACFGFPNQFVSSSTVNNTSSIVEHKWKFGDGTEQTTINNNITKLYNASATYATRLVVTTNNGCVDSTSVSLVVNPKPSANFTFNTVCLNQTTQFTSTSTISAGTLVSYFWNFDDNSNSSQANPSKVYQFPGTYNVLHVITSDSGCKDTSIKAVTVWPLISGNSISANQIICQGSVPSNLIGNAVVVGGNNSYTYIWQSSADSLNWQNVPGANAATLTFGSGGLTTTTFFRRIVFSGTCIDISLPIKITVLPILTGNFIGASQTICNGQIPTYLNGNSVIGGNGFYTYTWQTSPDSINWTNISGSNDTAYAPPAMTVTTYFRRIAQSGPCLSFSNVIKITVLPLITGNTIGSNQVVCLGQAAQPITGQVALGGGNGVYQFQWQYSTDGNAWVDIFGANTFSYAPGVLSNSSNYFRRKVTSGPCDNAQLSISNSIFIEILPVITNNSIASAQTICNGQSPILISGTLPQGGNGTYTYQWQSSTDSITWNNIIGQTQQNYQPNPLFQTTWFRRNVFSASCNHSSASIKVTVLPAISNNIISGNQTICSGQQPGIIIGQKPNGGQAGIYQYVWQDSSAVKGWGNIIGANDSSYMPPVLTASHFYRRIVISGPCQGAQSSASNIIAIIVNPNIANNLITQNQTICELATPALLNGITPAGGNGIYTYQWQSSPDTVTWTNIPSQGTGVNYQPPSLSSTIYYRRIAVSGPCFNNSNMVVIQVQPQISNNNIYSNQIICSGQKADTLSGTLPIGGNGISYNYQWQTSSDSVNWIFVPSSNLMNYYPGTINNDTYLRRIAFSGQCSLPSNVVKITTEPLPNVQFTFANACYPDTILFVQQSTIGKGTIVSYLWNFGDGSSSQILSPKKKYNVHGNYNVQLRAISAFGCIDSITKPAILYPKPTANFGFKNICFPDATDFTDSSIVAAGSITKWFWNFGDGTTSILKNPTKIYAASGSYFVTLVIETNNGCKDTITKEVRVHAKPKANFVANTPCFPSPVIFRDSSNISTGNITQRVWSFGNGDTSTLLNPQIQYTLPGAYLTRLIVWSDLGCADSVIKTVNINHLPVVDFKLDSLGCVGSAISISNNSTGAVNYLWRLGNLQTSTQVNPSITFNDTGIYQIKLIAFTGNNCRDSITKSIEITKPPIADFKLLPDSGCGPLLLRFTNTSQSRYSSFRWTDGLGNQEDAVQLADRTYMPSKLQDSLYFIRLTVTNLCGSSIKRDTLKVFPKPVANFAMNIDSGCTPLTVNFLNKTTGFPRFYQWNMGNGQTYVTSNPPSQTYLAFNNDTTYNIRLIVSNECGFDTIMKSVVVKKNNVKSFFTSDKTSGCAPLTVQFFNQSENTLFVSWTFDDGNGSTANNPIHTFTQSGFYRVKQFVSNGCGFDTSSILIHVLPAPTVSFTTLSDTLCERKQVRFLNTTSNAGALTWYFGTGDSSNLVNPSYVYTNAGKYAVTLKATSTISGCTNNFTDTVEIFDNPISDFNLSDVDICLNESVQLNNTSQLGDYFLWRFGDGRISSAVAPNIKYTLPGLYKVTLIASTLNGCVDSASKNIRVLEIPTAAFDFSPKQACDRPTTVNFTNQSTGSTELLWSFHNGSNTTLNNPTFPYSGVGTYPVKLVVKNQFGCKDSAQNQFIIYHQPKANFTTPNLSGCVPLTVVFQNSSLHAISQRWQFGTLDTSNNQTPTFIVKDSGIYDIKLIVEGEGGCVDSMIRTSYITAYPKPVADFAYVIKTSPAIDGTVTFFNQSKGVDLTSKWRFNMGSVSTETNPTYQFPYAGNFKIELEVATKYNCTDVIDTIIDFPFFGGLYVPNAFSPDDGSNDLVRQFLPAGTGLGEYRLEIYNTWGELVWFTEELRDTKPSQGWTGKNMRGDEMPQGVYVWKITAKYINGMPWEGMLTKQGIRSTIGDVILIR